jgi:hypothetical protein
MAMGCACAIIAASYAMAVRLNRDAGVVQLYPAHQSALDLHYGAVLAREQWGQAVQVLPRVRACTLVHCLDGGGIAGGNGIIYPMLTNQSIAIHDEYVSPADIISEDDQSALIHCRFSMTASAFAIGDITARYIDRAVANGFMVKEYPNGTKVQISQRYLFIAIGKFCGRSGRTVRYYYETARSYPQEVRDEFEMLDFRTFVVARKFGEQA